MSTWKAKILDFTWEDIRVREKFDLYINKLAQKYLELTRSSCLNKVSLIGAGNTNFFLSTKEWVEAINREDTKFVPISTQWGYTYFKTSHHFIDLTKIKSQSEGTGASAGLCLIDACWHEWGHSDIKERNEGSLLNSKYGYFSPISNTPEQWLKYRGAEILTKTYYGLMRFEEVLNETITKRRMVEEVGLESIVSAADYYKVGVDFFPELTIKLGIRLNTLYELHATSNFEELAITIGSHLRGNDTSLIKGLNFFIAIHESNKTVIDQMI